MLFITNFYRGAKQESPKKDYMRHGSHWRHSQVFSGNIPLPDIDVRLIEQYITWRKHPKEEKAVSNRTVNIDLIYLSQCLKKARECRFITENTCDFVPKLKENK
ncbi:MAG: phage integrase SAM-like domain-containing protein, partial [Candidatus Margulisbacteria bacterium]|nr:phage integrase SAM-like domain-containing protein [Candidatus Margulisiibacteriota bacterium]